ncbi:MAG TPA: DUF4350 domain-containing protein [Rubricoccaceae bacterium]|nr:DUF4350 domain-containing protein [Rubricoccaceae bacterium]
MKRFGPFLGLVLVVVLFVVVEATRPQPIDWTPSLEPDDARPFGTRVLAETVSRWLAGPDSAPVPLAFVDEPPYLFLADTSRRGTTYVFVTLHFAPDEAEAKRLLAYAARGNTVVVAAQALDGLLADSLGVSEKLAEGYDADPGLYFFFPPYEPQADSVLHLTSPGLARDSGYHYAFPVRSRYIEGLDPARTTVLGEDEAGLPTLARVRVGEGAFLLSSTPLAFTNAALLMEGDGVAYLAGALAHVPAQPLFWDTYHRPIAGEAQTPLRFLLRQPPLRLAYTLAVVGLLLFVLFRGRRWQRPVPVVAPPPNATREFTRTIGRLYFQHGDGRALAARRTRYFFDRLRTRHGLGDETLDLTPEAAARVARRTGVPPDEVAALFARLHRLQRSAHASNDDLLDLDRALDRFFRAAERA